MIRYRPLNKSRSTGNSDEYPETERGLTEREATKTYRSYPDKSFLVHARRARTQECKRKPQLRVKLRTVAVTLLGLTRTELHHLASESPNSIVSACPRELRNDECCMNGARGHSTVTGEGCQVHREIGTSCQEGTTRGWRI
jgi:hypothetical protein